MISSEFTLRRTIACVLFAGAASLLAPSAGAQSAETGIETIVVTGSNIPRPHAAVAAPVEIVSREQIERAGKATLGDYLQTLTVDGQGSIPIMFGTGFAAGAQGISMRGLGSGSTLVLLNGRRIAPYGLADDGRRIFTDLGVIPLEAVERIEVLKEGASAIYGSDAIAGVVNVILRSQYQGLTARGSYGLSEEGDGDTAKMSLTGGIGDLASDGYNVYFNVEGAKIDAIKVADRRGRKHIGGGDLRPYGYSVTGSQWLAGWIRGNIVSSSPTGTLLTPDDATPNPLPGCEQFAEISQEDAGGGCVWDLARSRDLTPDQEYIQLFGRGTLRLSDDFEAYAEVGYSRKETRFVSNVSSVHGAWGYPGGVVNASSGPGAVVLGPTHPDNTLFPGQSPRLRYAAWDVGPRTGEQTNEFYRAVVGLTGSIGAWDVDAAIVHSESDLRHERTGWLRYSRVMQALSGTGPVTWRIGDDAHLNSPDVYAYISPKIHSDGESQLDSIDVKASRALFDLPGGALRVALGAEYRRSESTLTPTTFTESGDIIGLGYSAFDGSQNQIAGFVELLAPILPQLDVSAALRHDRYMGATSSTTPKLGVKWSPVEPITLRGTYSEGFRMPNAAETAGHTVGFANVQDPIRCPNGTPAPGATAADCNTSVAVITGPNANLKPEESESYTIGLVLKPFAQTTLSIDAWEIKRTDEITKETVREAVERGDVIRNDVTLPGQPGTGQLLAANVNYINATSTKVRGIDVAFNQGFDLGRYGLLSFDLQWARTNSFEITQANGTKVEFAGTHGNCDMTNCVGTPKNRINAGLTWSVADWTIGAVMNYRGEMDNRDREGGPCVNRFADNVTEAPRGCRIPSFHSVDLSARWQVSEAMQLFGSVANAFDRIAPLDPNTYGAVNFNPLDSSGAIGRFFTLGMQYSFAGR